MPEKEAKVAKANVESQSLGQKRENSSVSISIEVPVREETSGGMNTMPEILQRFDKAVKRYNEKRAQAQAKPKSAPRGGVNASSRAR